MFERIINSDIVMNMTAPILALLIVAAVAGAVFGLCWVVMKVAKVRGAPAIILGLVLMIGGLVIAGFHGVLIGLLIGIFVLVFGMASRSRQQPPVT